MKIMGSVTHYGVGTLLAVALAVVLGSIPLFQNAPLGASKLTAAHLVQFLCYTGALIMLWMMGHRLTVQMPRNGRWVACLRPIIRPFVTLIVVLSAYVVIPLIAGPVIDKSARSAYDWFFIVGTVCAAMWLMMAWVLQSGAVLRAMEGRRGGR